MTPRVLFGLGLLLALGGPTTAVLQKERLLRQGRPVLLELAPRDPRSLMQGDYMDLDYALARTLQAHPDLPREGRAVLMQSVFSGWFLTLFGWLALATLWAFSRFWLALVSWDGT